MQILAFGDTHGILDFSYLEAAALQADIILCNGDVSNFRHMLLESLHALNAFAKKVGKQVLFTHGNHEGLLDHELFEKFDSITYLHEQAHPVNKKVTVIGYGGGGFARESPAFEQYITQAHAMIEHGVAVVWLIHGPPRDLVVDYIEGWGPTGNQSITRMIDLHQPTLVVAGHIHDAHGTHTTAGDSLVINPGPEGMLITLEYKDHSNTN